jgi:methylmalonyl-CoA/ethylmalonyl-CoA epimerase
LKFVYREEWHVDKLIGDVIELSIVVRDIDEAVKRFGDLYGLKVEHLGESEEFGFKNAILPLGKGHIELLQPTDPNKAVGKFLDRRGEGVYLVGFATEDIAGAAEHIRTQGAQVDTRSDRIAWVHPRESHGVLVELRKPDEDSQV